MVGLEREDLRIVVVVPGTGRFGNVWCLQYVEARIVLFCREALCHLGRTEKQKLHTRSGY